MENIDFLVDTNVFLEVLLEQENSATAIEFLSRTKAEHLFLSDFSLHSIGVILIRLKRYTVLANFIDDVIVQTALNVISLNPEELTQLSEISLLYGLDFDDAYQYVLAKRERIIIVSYEWLEYYELASSCKMWKETALAAVILTIVNIIVKITAFLVCMILFLTYLYLHVTLYGW